MFLAMGLARRGIRLPLPRAHRRFRLHRLHDPRLRPPRKSCPTSGQAAGTVASVDFSLNPPPHGYFLMFPVIFVFYFDFGQTKGAQRGPNSHQDV